MIPRAPLLVLILLLAGCGGRDPPPQDAFLVDPRDDAEPRFDILRANVTELNGSLVVVIDIRNYNASLPLFEVRLGTSGGDFFARIVPDATRRTAPQVRAESGRVGEAATAEPCWFPSFPTDPQSPGPWLLLIEFLHNQTGLETGGTVERMEIVTRDSDGSDLDEAEATRSLAVAGGPNRYAPGCPLYNERERVVPA